MQKERFPAKLVMMRICGISSLLTDTLAQVDSDRQMLQYHYAIDFSVYFIKNTAMPWRV